MAVFSLSLSNFDGMKRAHKKQDRWKQGGFGIVRPSTVEQSLSQNCWRGLTPPHPRRNSPVPSPEGFSCRLRVLYFHARRLSPVSTRRCPTICTYHGICMEQNFDLICSTVVSLYQNLKVIGVIQPVRLVVSKVEDIKVKARTENGKNRIPSPANIGGRRPPAVHGRKHKGTWLFVVAKKVSSWDESEGGYQTNYTGPRSYLTAISEKLEVPAETCLGKAKNDAGEARMDSK